MNAIGANVGSNHHANCGPPMIVGNTFINTYRQYMGSRMNLGYNVFMGP